MQTGTGKTHTMLGTKESHKSDVEHADWGIFPRLAFTVLKRVDAVKDDKNLPTNFIVTVSAVEFYLSQVSPVIKFNLRFVKV